MKRSGRGAMNFYKVNRKDLAVIQWFNKKSVTLASNFVTRDPVDYVDRYDKKEKGRIRIQRPAAVAIYFTTRTWAELI